MPVAAEQLLLVSSREAASRLCPVLRSQGLRVRVGQSVDALPLQLAAGQFDLALLDLGCLSGLLPQGLPLIYFDSGLTELPSQAQLRLQGIEPGLFLADPTDAQALRTAIEFCLYKHRAESKLKSLEQFLASSLTSVGDAVISTDLQGRVTFINPVAEALIGWRRGESLGKPAAEIVRIVDARTHQPLPDPWGEALRGQVMIGSGEAVLLLARDGAEVPVANGIAPLRDESGQPRGTILVLRDLTVRQSPHGLLSALHDTLTELPNRALFMDRLQRAVERARRIPGERFAVLFLDLNRFKAVNDSLGHHAGDELLVGTARRLETCVRSIDTLARFGGDEFAILLEGIQQVSDATRVAERIHQSLQVPFQIQAHDVTISTSIGIALAGSQALDPEQLLQQADSAMYRAKQQGPGRYEVFDPLLHRYAKARAQWEEELRRALEQEQLRVCYQPIVNLATGYWQAVEALLYWEHPERGWLSGREFLGVAEESGLAVELGDWLIQSTFRQWQQWRAQYSSLSALPLHLNLLPQQFAQPDLAQRLHRWLQEFQLSGSLLHLGLTGTMLMEASSLVEQQLHQLQLLGAALILERFGSGYVCLQRLSHLPLQGIRLDAALAQAIGPQQREPDKALLAALRLAEILNLPVAAPAIETSEQALYLHRMGCERGQGSLFYPPLAAGEMGSLLGRETLAA
ncbi:MAG: diguanylate cyclase [Thermostichus sp. DG02_5_bins_236]